MQACGKKEQNTFRLRSLSVETLSRTEICKLEKKKKPPRGNHFPFFPPHAENISFSNIMVTRG